MPLGCRVQGLGFRAQRIQSPAGLIWGLGFRVQGLGFRNQGLGFWVLGFGCDADVAIPLGYEAGSSSKCAGGGKNLWQGLNPGH